MKGNGGVCECVIILINWVMCGMWIVDMEIKSNQICVVSCVLRPMINTKTVTHPSMEKVIRFKCKEGDCKGSVWELWWVFFVVVVVWVLFVVWVLLRYVEIPCFYAMCGGMCGGYVTK